MPFFALLVCFCVAFTAHPLCAAPVARAADDSTTSARQLIVLFDPTDERSPSPDAILAAVPDAHRQRAPSRANQKRAEIVAARDLRTALGNPTAAQLALNGVAPTDRGSKRAPSKPSLRNLLDRYVVLTFATSEQTEAARTALSADARVRSVQANRRYRYFAIPNDRFFSADAAQPFEGNYQWGMHALNLPQAWDIERGYAHISALDSGIPCDELEGTCRTTSHPDLLQNFRPQFSASFDREATLAIHSDLFGHGSHVAGIIAATPEYGLFHNGNANSGVTGACWTCSFSMLQLGLVDSASLGRVLTYGVDHGAQVMNMSFGDLDGDGTDFCALQTHAFAVECAAFAYARERDVVLVAASGNAYAHATAFPASSGNVIAVGGIQYAGDGAGSFWRTSYAVPPCAAGGGAEGQECGSNFGPQQAVVAPAKDILSTFLTSVNYNDEVHCGDAWGPGASDDGYGDCTGTSMSAPHISGIVGLLRSANPLLNRDQIKALLVTYTNPCVGVDNDKCGAGVPDAGRAVKAALGNSLALNRLTPLFGFYSEAAEDHFYTAIPQMALAALTPGGLLPQPIGNAPVSIDYASVGSAVVGYAFPCVVDPCPATKAIASVFVSHVNPTGGAELVPLRRYSYACGQACTSANGNHVSHVYATDANEDWTSAGYQLDGSEGYVFPKSAPQPAGSAKLCRKYDSTRHDYVLFLGSGPNGLVCTATTDGYAGGNYSQSAYSNGDWIGWAYPIAPSVAPIGLGGYMSGAWYAASQAGQGFVLEFLSGNAMIATWYTFAPAGGAQNWIYAQGSYEPTLNTATLQAALPSGASFPPHFNPSDETPVPWGTLKFTFFDCNNGTVSWSSTVPGYGSGTFPISRLTRLSGTACP